jgi:hypothetical protein
MGDSFRKTLAPYDIKLHIRAPKADFSNEDLTKEPGGIPGFPLRAHYPHLEPSDLVTPIILSTSVHT